LNRESRHFKFCVQINRSLRLIGCSQRGVLRSCGPFTFQYKSSAAAEMGDRGHNRHGPKRGVGASLPISRWSWVPVYHNVAWAEVYFRTKWCLHPYNRSVTIDVNRKLGAEPLLWGAATPLNTRSPGPRFTSAPSGILIHPAIWPQ